MMSEATKRPTVDINERALVDTYPSARILGVSNDFEPHELAMTYDNLDALLEHIWNYVESAVINRANAMTTPAFATAGADGPNVRTVALRRANRASRALVFHTDARSQKVNELEEMPVAVWMAWDAGHSEQFQLRGRTSLHLDDEVASTMWASLPDDELALYYKPQTPGTPTDEPDSGIHSEGLDESEARQKFAVVRTVVDEIKWLYVARSPDDARQARFAWDGKRFVGEWVVP